MINRVKIENVATYTNPVDVTLKDINFIYGGNGTGKTTFTKIISGELIAPLCVVENPTANNERLLVYNKSFDDENFREVGDISGIFTLGRDAGELIEYIKQKEAEHV
jgi:translation initiation factor RLI1